MNKLMLDLETLDTRISAVVLSIGVAIFDETTILAKFNIPLEVDDQIDKGRTISGSTVDWWMNQSEDARNRLFSDEAQRVRHNVVRALIQFQNLCLEYGIKEVWGNGADFDNLILGSLYDTYGIKKPWSYGKNRCFRTMKNLVPKSFEPVREGVHHDAMDDAVHQAKWLIGILQSLTTKRELVPPIAVAEAKALAIDTADAVVAKAGDVGSGG